MEPQVSIAAGLDKTHGHKLNPNLTTLNARAWVDHWYSDVRRWEVMPRGGHFAAWEQPKLLAEQITAFFLDDCDAPALIGASKSRL